MQRVMRFLRAGVWEVDLRKCAWPKRVGIAALRVVIHTIATYESHMVGVRASGLTLVTLLSIVPLAAVGFAIAGAFGFRETLEGWLHQNTGELPDYMATAVQHIEDVVQRTSFKALGTVGTIVLLWTGMTMFTRVEESLNFAWRTRLTRRWLHRMSSFIALIVLVPALLLGALTISAALSSGPFVEGLRDDLPSLMRFYDAGLWLVPHAMAWIAFTALYMFMPSTVVRWKPAVMAGVLAGSSMLAMHALYVEFQVGVARANTIYATLAALPLLLAYLQIAWTIVLLGAEVGFALQNLHVIGPGRDPETLSFATRERIALRLVERAVEAHEAGEGPLSLTHEAQAVDVPREWLERVVDDLERGRILARTRNQRVLPVRPGERIALAHVLEALRGQTPARLRQRLTLSARLAAAVEEAERAEARHGTHAFVPHGETLEPTEPTVVPPPGKAARAPLDVK